MLQELLNRYPESKNIICITETECLLLSEERLRDTKDVFILERFHGRAFEHIRQMKNVK
jgi:hypothetical protein